MKKFLACVLAVANAGCPDVKVDTDEGPSDAPVVEFDPGNKIIPFPNNLLLTPAGIVNLPAQCNETATAKALRENVLNKLDGFGTYQSAMTVTFTEAVDPASLEGNVLLFKRVGAGMPVTPADSMPIPVVTRVGLTQRFDAACTAATPVDQVAIIPLVPLDQRSTYVVALKQGIKTATGAHFTASFTWSLIRQLENPVTFDDAGNVTSDRTPLDPSKAEDYATLQGIDLLWNAHHGAMQFLDDKAIAHEDVLLAWEFNTQTISDPLDGAVNGSPASQIPAATVLVGTQSVLPPGATGEQFMQSRLPAGSCQADGGPLPCQAVGDVLAGGLPARQYQTERPNPLGTMPLCGPANNRMPCGPVPGPWSDPRTPAFVKVEPVVALAFAPAAPCAATGCPTVIFQHGITRSKNDVLAIASQLTGLGYNVVAIDAVAHGSRAIRISDAAARGCGGDVDVGTAPQCFAPFLSPDLENFRDGIRQTLLDQQSLITALKTCGTTNCGGIKVDPAHIEYIGQSLGGIMGSMTHAMREDIKASVLNVSGVGWIDVLENTKTRAFTCTLVDGLIAAGILTGAPWNIGDPANPNDDTGLCTTEEWKAQPGYRQFSVIGRWILDPADPANYAVRLRARRFLLQEVVDDTVVPNIATDNEAKIAGVFAMAADADPSVPNMTTGKIDPSPAILMNPMSSKFLRYKTLPAGGQFPGNTYTHGSVLAPPAGSGAAGALATGKMQTDAFTFLFLNK